MNPELLKSLGTLKVTPEFLAHCNLHLAEEELRANAATLGLAKLTPEEHAALRKQIAAAMMASVTSVLHMQAMGADLSPLREVNRQVEARWAERSFPG